MRDRIQVVPEPAPIEGGGEFEGQHYVWKFIGSPIRINLSLDVVARMRERLAESLEPDANSRRERTRRDRRLRTIRLQCFRQLLCHLGRGHAALSGSNRETQPVRIPQVDSWLLPQSYP